ncbi:serine palmitoyltransferase component [Conoideocrella luteorostrata]|uniref:Serine palmitoyltransferase component n=1 Tax=Conoideocrella luteorostrata TaxID=1105319 RepID=A0AAJ0FX66_9HYPO|nr:serine palmitoyltransferase component [Conoideocrella luteorostrata]
MARLATWFAFSLVLGRFAAGQSAGKHYVREHTQHGPDIIVYDSSITTATRVREVIHWVNKAGEALGIATENVLLLPTSLALEAASNESEIATGMTSYCTQTLISPSSENPPLGNDDSSATSAGLPAPIAAPTIAVVPVAQSIGLPSNVSENQGDGSKWFGVSYTPYRADQSCKSQQDVDDDFKRMAGLYAVVRVYGTDCDQVPLLYSAAKRHGMKLFLGVWNPSSGQDEANKIIAGVNGDWNIVHTVSVGNELINNGETSPEDLIRSMGMVRSVLRAAGYNGPVVTVDTFTAALAHPELCNESDYCAINAHPFFDGTISATQSGTWLQKTVSNIRSNISGNNKKIVITETGWPTKGATNGVAVPSLQNQKAALDSIREKFASNSGDIILFSAFNDLWKKKDMITFNADQFWGIDGAISTCDQ